MKLTSIEKAVIYRLLINAKYVKFSVLSYFFFTYIPHAILSLSAETEKFHTKFSLLILHHVWSHSFNYFVPLSC